TIQVQLGRLLSGWAPSVQQLDVAKRYLCGLLFHHLCPRNKADVWQRLQQMTSIQLLLNEDTLETANQRKRDRIGIMPNAKVGSVELNLPDAEFEGKKILVLGIGSFSQFLAEVAGLDLTFCSDLPADCQQKMANYPVNLYEPALLEQAQVVLICWPTQKCWDFINSLEQTVFADKALYHIEKLQLDSRCEFHCKALEIK